MSFFKNVADLRAAQRAAAASGAKMTVRDLRAATKANMAAGRGSRSMIEAVEQLGERAPPPPPPKLRPSPARAFLLWFLAGAVWQGSRGSRGRRR